MRHDLVNVRRPDSSHAFQQPSMRLGRSQFQLRPSHKTMFDAGYLVPYFVMEVCPGDTIQCRLNAITRVFSPLDAPMMDDIRQDIDFWYVPNRVV